MVVGVASVAGAKTAEMFFLDRRTIAELGQISGPFTIALLDRMRSKTEVNYRKLLGACAFIRQIKVELVKISTPSQQHYARKISN
jgi:hypothetical protein